MIKTIKNFTTLGIDTLRLKKSDSELSAQKSIQAILKHLASERGVALKIAQLIGSNSENLAQIKSVTQGQLLEAIPLDQLKDSIENSLSRNLTDIFEHIDEAKWVASLGQVHPCILKDDPGFYVMKVQYPGMDQKVKEQLRLFGIFGQLGAKTKLRKWGFDIGDYLINFQKSLATELDYRIEEKNLLRFKKFNQERDILFPDVLPELTRKNILVTRYMTGETVDHFVQNATISDKKMIGQNLLKIYLEQLLEDGFVQGDTHKGNFLIYNRKIVFLDFGHFLELSSTQRNALQHLLNGVVHQNLTNEVGILKELGFDREKLSPIQDRISQIIDIMFEPFKTQGDFDMSQWKPQERIEELIGDHKWWFRSSGSAEFFQLIRSFWGPCLIIKDLKTPIDWNQVAKEILAKLAPADVIEKVELKLDKAMAKNLRIEVIKEDQKTVDLFLPATAVKNLHNLIDEDLKEKIRHKGYDLEQIQLTASQNEFAPMDLFELHEANKSYKVFLE